MVVSPLSKPGEGEARWDRVLVPVTFWHLEALRHEMRLRFPGLPHEPPPSAIERFGSSAWRGLLETNMRELAGRLL